MTYFSPVFAGDQSCFSSSIRSSLGRSSLGEKIGEQPEGLKELRSFLDQQGASQARAHQLIFNPAGVTLKIGHLDRSQQKFMLLAMRAIKEGSISSIDAGQIIGPKVLIMLDDMLTYAKKYRVNLTIEGVLSPKVIRAAALDQQARGISETPNAAIPEIWSQKEVQAFNDAYASFKIEDCNKFIGFQMSPLCRFKIEFSGGRMNYAIRPR